MEDLLLLLRAAAEDTRLRILALAARDQLTVSEFVDILGQSQPRVSRHLKLMVEAGLLERFREGQWAYFRLADMYALPFPSMSVDVVSIHQVLHYAEDPAAVLREAARVLAPGGTALIADFAPHDLVELRREHAHVHLGFADNQVAGWLAAA